ncbi:MAG: hypothetical protein UHL07_04285 [Bacteroidaceae bacterium]|nr:hypothetical protein [Bacteroidaceae bacterium]
MIGHGLGLGKGNGIDVVAAVIAFSAPTYELRTLHVKPQIIAGVLDAEGTAAGCSAIHIRRADLKGGLVGSSKTRAIHNGLHVHAGESCLEAVGRRLTTLHMNLEYGQAISCIRCLQSAIIIQLMIGKIRKFDVLVEIYSMEGIRTAIHDFAGTGDFCSQRRKLLEGVSLRTCRYSCTGQEQRRNESKLFHLCVSCSFECLNNKCFPRQIRHKCMPYQAKNQMGGVIYVNVF